MAPSLHSLIGKKRSQPGEDLAQGTGQQAGRYKYAHRSLTTSTELPPNQLDPLRAGLGTMIHLTLGLEEL